MLSEQCGSYWTLFHDRTSSNDVKAAMLEVQNNETIAIFVYQIDPLGVQLFSYVNTSFCFNKCAQVLAT